MTTMEIMDVNPIAVVHEIEKHGVRVLIHGHTHRPGVHEIEVGGQRCTRIVLGDWYTQSSVLRYHDGVFTLCARGRRYPPVETR